MYCIELQDGIHKAIDGYNKLGFWYREDAATVTETRMKMFYSIYILFLPISLMAGAIASDSKDEAMLLAETAIISTVMVVRLYYLMWKQNEINELLQRVGIYPIKDEEVFTVVDDKLKTFMKWIIYFFCYSVFMAICVNLIAPFIGSENNLFLNIGFPLDYKNNDLAYWIAILFLTTETSLTAVAVSFSIVIWYLLLNCGLRYQVLGSELENMGVIRTADATDQKRKISEVEKRHLFDRDLIAGIESHKEINNATQQLESLFSHLFSVQLATSAACICASIYILAFNTSANIIDYVIYLFYLFYNIFDIFMVMYFGNEIELFSDGISYCLFRSNWIEQSQSCKLTLIIFGERLKQAKQLIVLKLYPLTLETFTRILNGAYSMFNILKTLAM